MTDRTKFVLRYRHAIARLGGAGRLLSLPRQITDGLKETTDLIQKVQLLEQLERTLRKE